LDEGIDIPNTRNALIMASSKTEREWIQRRGRLLRKSPGKQRATIYDCVVVPARIDEDGNILDAITSTEVSIVNGELLRATEFAQSAINASQALLSIENIKGETSRVKVE
jgi:predicted helicase